MKAERRAGQIWGLLAFVAIASTTLSLTSLDSARSQPALLTCPNATECQAILDATNFTCTDGRHFGSAMNCSDLCVDATDGAQCATLDQNPCLEVVCSGGNCSELDPFVPPSCNDGNPCTADSCDVCATNCTGACVHTPLNSTGCNLSLGEVCTVGGQCTSTFCSEGVCCDIACTGPIESCNVPGSVGHCITRAPAPVASRWGVLTIALLLAAIGVRSLWRALGAPRH